MFEIFRKQNVSLSSLYLSGYLPEFELTEFIEQSLEKQSLEKLHVRGRFLNTCIFTIRKDFDEIQKIMKMVFSDFHDWAEFRGFSKAFSGVSIRISKNLIRKKY